MSNVSARNAPAGRGNPFATRHTRPGQLPFLFPPGQNAEALVGRLRAADWWGEIVGPHGSGKSTLLATLLEALTAAGRELLVIELHDGQRRLPAEIGRTPRLKRAAQVVIDGYEQLSRWQRLRIKRRCRLAGCGLLVTSHASVGLPQLYQTRSDLDLAMRIVEQLLDGRQGAITPAQIERCFQVHGGNLRETLFALYDLYERRKLQERRS